MLPKDTIIVEVDMEEPEKAKAGSGEPKTMKVAGVRKRPTNAGSHESWTGKGGGPIWEGNCWNRRIGICNWKD